jgi:uncharacterized SAM-binding protein YcdF (DUF218 family)
LVYGPRNLNANQLETIHRILLVTSAMHMPRAAGTFRKVGFELPGH